MEKWFVNIADYNKWEGLENHLFDNLLQSLSIIWKKMFLSNVREKILIIQMSEKTIKFLLKRYWMVQFKNWQKFIWSFLIEEYSSKWWSYRFNKEIPFNEFKHRIEINNGIWHKKIKYIIK